MKRTLTRKNWKSVVAGSMLSSAMVLLMPLPGQSQGNPGQAAAPTGNADKGKELFHSYGCYACHGMEGQGGVAGPRIGVAPPPFPVFSAYVRKPANQMPPYTEKVVSDQELADIHAYLRSRPQPKPVTEIPLLKN